MVTKTEDYVISMAVSYFDISGVLKVIATVASTLLPIVTDLIAKIVIKRKNQ